MVEGGCVPMLYNELCMNWCVYCLTQTDVCGSRLIDLRDSLYLIWQVISTGSL